MYKYIIYSDYKKDDTTKYISMEKFSKYEDAYNAGLKHIDAWESVNETYGKIEVIEVE